MSCVTVMASPLPPALLALWGQLVEAGTHSEAGVPSVCSVRSAVPCRMATEAPSWGWGEGREGVRTMTGAVPRAPGAWTRDIRNGAGVTSGRLGVTGCPSLHMYEQQQAWWALRSPPFMGLGDRRSGGYQEGCPMSDLCQISGTVAQPQCGCREPDKTPPMQSGLCLGSCFGGKGLP